MKPHRSLFTAALCFAWVSMSEGQTLDCGDRVFAGTGNGPDLAFETTIVFASNVMGDSNARPIQVPPDMEVDGLSGCSWAPTPGTTAGDSGGVSRSPDVPVFASGRSANVVSKALRRESAKPGIPGDFLMMESASLQTYSVVPEPSSVLLVCATGLLVMSRRRLA